MSEQSTAYTDSLNVANSPLAQSEGRELQAHGDHHHPDQPTQAPAKTLVKYSLLEFIDVFTESLMNIQEMETYLQMREQLLQTLKLCEKKLELHEAKTFIPMLEKQQSDSLRFNKWEVSYKPSRRRIIDLEKLKRALPDPQLLAKFLKPQEFKPLPDCQRLMHKYGIYSDVFTTKYGNKSILKIVDTNTIKREIEEVEEDAQQ